MLDYGVFENILSSWPKAEIPLEVSEDSLLERIRQILAEAGISNDVTKWKADIIPLIRHYLLRDSARKGKKSSLRVPSHSGWPNVEEWRRHGIWVWPISDNAFILKPEPWCPEWLDAGEEGVFADAFKDEKVRQEGYCEADPFITEATGYTTYFCPGQREAIRASFLMRHGHTLIVNLPTGSGKSLVGQAPALVHKQDGNLVLFVVPTVALAIDQERQMKEYFNKNKELDRLWPLAWHAGLSGEDRHEIRSRMRYGTQRILFTSPEAIMTSLLREVFDVARSGMLGYLVIDEAHLVTQWGDEFRPEFQGLAAIRNAMLRQSGEYAFRTLLLSATFTAETIETLASLFGPRDKVDLVSAVHLRPEPQYWFSRANHSDDKQSKVLEALRHAPRPFILYVTRPKEAEHWHSLLKSRVGLNRIECFHGKTDYSSRYRIIQAWTENKLDGIVATSAFGLGIDKQDVRTIIHATIPETVDRFYQEVGRGGRDGKTSVSLLIFEDADWRFTKSARPRIISSELGFRRWSAMYASRKKTDAEGLIEISLDAVPSHRKESNEEDRRWNMRTLLLMVRAGMIELDKEPYKQIPDMQGEIDYVPSSLTTMADFGIRILNNGHKIPEEWDRLTALSRDGTSEFAKKNIKLLLALINRRQEVSEILAKLYRIKTPRWEVDVTRSCGGCCFDREQTSFTKGYHVPIAAPIMQVVEADFSKWRDCVPWLDPVLALVFYEEELGPSIQLRKILRLLRWLVSKCGVRELSADRHKDLCQSNEFTKLYHISQDGFLLHRNLNQLEEEPYSPLARVTILSGETAGEDYLKVAALQRNYHIIIIPKDTPDPRNTCRCLIEINSNHISLDHFLEVISK